MQLTGLDCNRKTLRLGEARERAVAGIRTHVDELREAQSRRRWLCDETQARLEKIHENTSSPYGKLAKLAAYLHSENGTPWDESMKRAEAT